MAFLDSHLTSASETTSSLMAKIKPAEMKVGGLYKAEPPDFIKASNYRLPMFSDEEIPHADNDMGIAIPSGSYFLVAATKPDLIVNMDGHERTMVLVSYRDVVGWIYPTAPWPNFEAAPEVLDE